MSFPITCTACHKTFTISDEIYEKKVAGRVVTIKCKSCAQGIRVDGTQGGAAAPGTAAAPAAAAPPPAAAAPSAAAASSAVEAARAAAPAAAPVQAGEPLWAVDYPDGQDREFTTGEVVTELQRGTINRATLVWREGMGEWLEISQVSELAGELAKIEEKKKAAAAAAKAAAAAAAAPVHKPRAPMPTVTGLAGLPGATGGIKAKATQPSTPDAVTPRPGQTSSPELAKPRPQQTSSPELAKPRLQQTSSPELAKPRAQQPSAPVLPKPGFVASPPAAAPPPIAAAAPAPPVAPPPAIAAPLPFAAPPSPLAAPPAPLPVPDFKADVTPPLPASVAKVVSRPPQIQPAFPAAAPVAPPAFGTAPALVADHASVEWPEAKKKSPLIILGVVAVLALVGGAVLLLNGKDEVPPPAPITALPPSPPRVTTPNPASTPAPASTNAQPGADTAAGSDPIAATPGAGFAELFAAGARKAESKGATVAPTARFDPAVTKAPLAQAARDAQACKQSGGPTGKVTVVITFDPSGKVSGASITEPPFAGTPTATCIASALKRATIAPFSGLPGTVSKTFSIL